MGSPGLPPAFEIHERDGVGWIETDLGDHRVLFSLRAPSGADPGSEDLDMGTTAREITADQIEARSRLCRAAGLDPARIRLARQVHGSDLVDMRRAASPIEVLADGLNPVTEADGFLIPEVGHVEGAMIVTADCVPVAIRGDQGLALLHLGWRSLAGGLLEAAIGQVGVTEAVIGPGIGPCCYEVGPDVARALGVVAPAGRHNLDLAGIVVQRLRESGVQEVESTGLCTCCEKELFFSHRRDGAEAGRQGTVIFPR